MKDQSIDNETVGNEQEKKVSTGIEPTGIAPCAIYGVHRMIAQGGAHTYDYKTKNTIKYLAHFYKCKCGEKVVCEGQPDSQFYDPLYNYVTEGGIKDAAG
ncbi:hypothetical protein [Ornithinibacillus scapharcae]|uniref:hypothetical protein n=1 Tax=Ornithinibacillus scapharcae TaxID=1147159 RepID=UPI000225B5DD|nr:hypothetical protein [Ornithinibacillus scapharcae]